MTAFPDIRHHVELIIGSADSAVAQGRLTGTQDGPFVLPDRTIRPSGRRVDVRLDLLGPLEEPLSRSQIDS